MALPPSLNTLSARLAHAMERAGKNNQSELAREIGVKPQAIQYLLNPTNGATGSKHIAAIAAALNVSSIWLSSGAEPMGNGGSPGNVESGPASRGQVPLISWVRAGEFCEAADPFSPGDAERWMDCPVKHSATTFALRVRGDSMTAPHGNGRTYPEGCIIFVDPEKRSPVNGERIVACLDGSHEVTFKVYKNEDGRQWLQPLNPTHEPIREPFKVLGTVLGKWEDG